MTRRRSKYEESCCTRRTSLELALIAILLVAILFSIALAVLLTLPASTPTTCTSTQCIIEASQIAQHLDSAIDPCDDFYKFSCGNFLKNSHGDETLGPFSSVQENVERQLIELYSEPLQSDEHQMVTTAKTLFRLCMDEYTIENDDLQTIVKALEAIGGWPVVEGSNWDDTKFNWVKATYRLRDLGYPFAIFMNLLVTSDPTDNNRYMFEVALPTEDLLTADLTMKEFMTDVAVLFGADENDALNEMGKIIEFMRRMEENINRHVLGEIIPHLSTVNDFQRKHGYYVNWLEFINTIANPAAQISGEDFVIFPQPAVLKEWFYLISKTSKRDQANYMMWKIIEATIPFLPEKLRKHKMQPKFMPSAMVAEETRAQFCLREIQARFSPSPINVMYARKYLDNGKKKKIEVMVYDIKQEFIEILGKASWMDEQDKRNIIEKVQEMTVIFGAPDDYLDDNMLDNFDTGMFQTPNETFLSLLSKVNRNHQTNQYKQVYKIREDLKLEGWYLGTISDYQLYNVKDNAMRIPITLLQGVFFNDDRPNYLNYGGIGTGIGHEFVDSFSSAVVSTNKEDSKIIQWSKKTTEAYFKNINCISTTLMEFELEENNKLISGLALIEGLALKITYEAYRNWIDENGEELQLTGTKYTPKQLFWIAAAITTCQPKNLYNSLFSILDESDYIVFALTIALRHNPNFVEDFRCPIGSYMNPKEKCPLL